jgi:hypothetical protein
MGSQLFTISDTWSWPAGVTQVIAEAIGGGGGGGEAQGNPSTGGGGKGGGYAKKTISKSIESQLSITVGAGGAGGVNGNPSEVTQSASVVLRASGGNAGAAGTTNSSNGAGATGANGAAVGDTTFAGGNGGTGNFTSGVQGSGAGGGAAHAAGNGSNALVNVAGSGVSSADPTSWWFANGGTYSGAGAQGVGNSTAGADAPAASFELTAWYGGGGSGGKANNNTNRNGGAGRQGVVLLTWTDPIPATRPMTLLGVG